MHVPRTLLAAIALSAACAHGRAHRAGDERLTGVDFEGNHQLSHTALLTGLGLHRTLGRGGAPDPYMVQVDTERIRGQYLREGFLDVGVTSRVERKGDDARVIYTVEEGPRATTRTVITGLPPDVPLAKVRAQLPLQDGKPFEYQPFDLAKPQLLGVVQDAGYAHARLDASVIADRAEHAAIVELAYAPGPRCRFGNVEITGATGDLAEAVRDRLAFSPGQQYSTQAVVQTQRNLYGFGRFSTVRVEPDKSSGGEVVAVEVAVAEGSRHEVTLGGGFGLDQVGFEVRGRAGYTIKSWPFPLDTVTLDLRPAYGERSSNSGTTWEPRIRAIARLERQDLFWTYAKGTVEAGYKYLTVEAYTNSGPLARLGFETPLWTPRVLLRAGWRLEQVSYSSIDPAIAAAMNDSGPLTTHLRIDRSERIGGYQQALVVDLRDHPLEPRLGAYGELQTFEGTPFGGGASSYLSILPDVRGYVPLVLGSVVAAHARYGAIWGDVPATERLFSGGASSQRGFGERRLSPGVPGMSGGRAIPYGGAGLIDTGIEARVPITTVRNMPVGVATFLDGGDVTDRATGLDVTNLHWAVGAGLRVQTAVGPARLDVAYRLNRKEASDPDPGSAFAYHLSIGEAF